MICLLPYYWNVPFSMPLIFTGAKYIYISSKRVLLTFMYYMFHHVHVFMNYVLYAPLLHFIMFFIQRLE